MSPIKILTQPDPAYQLLVVLSKSWKDYGRLANTAPVPTLFCDIQVYNKNRVTVLKQVVRVDILLACCISCLGTAELIVAILLIYIHQKLTWLFSLFFSRSGLVTIKFKSYLLKSILCEEIFLTNVKYTFVFSYKICTKGFFSSYSNIFYYYL